MKRFAWNVEKSLQLKAERGVSFEDALYQIERGNVLDLVDHPNRERYPNQRMWIVEIDDYAWLVPFVESEQEIFLKTIIPSRKATRQYLGER